MRRGFLLLVYKVRGEDQTPTNAESEEWETIERSDDSCAC